MDQIALALQMKRLAAWLDARCEPDNFVRRQFDGPPFGQCYVTIDAERQRPFASVNMNRVHLCGAESGLTSDGIARLIDLFKAEGVGRFFVWLSPGPDLEAVRGWLDAHGLSANPAHRLSDTVAQGPSSRCLQHRSRRARSRGRRDRCCARSTRRYGVAGIFAIRGQARFLPLHGVRRPPSGRDCRVMPVRRDRIFDGGRDGGERSQARRAAGSDCKTNCRAEQSGCSIQVSETLYMIEHSLRNLQRAGFEEAYEKEVYGWSA